MKKRIMMINNKKNFKGFDYYELQQDSEGNIKLNDYNCVINARRARVDMLLDSTEADDENFIRLDEALREKLLEGHELFDTEDREIAQKKGELLRILDNLNDLSEIESQDLLDVSLLLSDLSYVEKNVVLNVNQDDGLNELKDLFIEKNPSGENYTDDDYRDLVDYLDRVNNIIKLELSDRIDSKNSKIIE